MNMEEIISIEYRVSEIRKHMDNLDMVRRGFDYLGDRAKESDLKKKLLMNNGSMEIMVEGCKRYKSDEHTQRFAFFTVYFLCKIESFRFPSAYLGMIDIILDSFQRHQYQERLHFNGCAALAQITMDKRAIPIAICLGAEQLVNRVIQYNPATSSVYYSGSTRSWGNMILDACKEFQIARGIVALKTESKLFTLFANGHPPLPAYSEDELFGFEIESKSDHEKAGLIKEEIEEQVGKLNDLAIKTRENYIEAAKRLSNPDLVLDDLEIIQIENEWIGAYREWQGAKQRLTEASRYLILASARFRDIINY